MNTDQENSDSDRDSHLSSKDFTSEGIEPLYENDSSCKLEQPIEPDNVKPIDEESVTGGKKFSRKERLSLLFLIITLSVGGYFYTQKKEIDLPITLPSDFNNSFPITTEPPKPLAAQSKTLPIESAPKIVEQAKETSTLKKPISENKKTINLLRNEIRSLKTELTQKNITSSTQNVQNIMPHISGGALGKATKELDEKERGKPEPEIQVLTPPTPVRIEPTFKQSQHQKTSPQRSKEVQAYLDFVEDTGNKLFRLIKEWSNRLLGLVL